MSAMFKGIKICLYKPNSQRLAISAADKVDVRNKNANRDVMTATERRAYILDKVNTDIKNYDAWHYWPEFWLAFLVCSIPVNDFITTRRLGLISLVPVAVFDKEAKKVLFLLLLIETTLCISVFYSVVRRV